MAGLKRRRGKWYARVMIWDGVRQKERQIPLRTELKIVALERLIEVEKVEVDIKAGLNISFPWLNNEGLTKVVHLTLKEAVNKYLQIRQNSGIAENTVKRDINSFNAFMLAVGETFPVACISCNDIESFKKTFKGKHTPEGINLNLRAIKTFLNWCEDRGIIPKRPQVIMVKTPKKPPSYIPDTDWAEIMKLDWLDDHFKRAFYFYRETGCRLSEPFYARRSGNWLIIPPEYTKQKIEKEVELTDELVSIWEEMKSKFELTKWKPVHFIRRYTKEFKKACRAVGISNHFHDLRHTFAVRRWLQTGDIYLVKHEMGHASVVTTEKYAKFSRKRLAVDFPTLSDYSKNVKRNGRMSIMDTVSMDTSEVHST